MTNLKKENKTNPRTRMHLRKLVIVFGVTSCQRYLLTTRTKGLLSRTRAGCERLMSTTLYAMLHCAMLRYAMRRYPMLRYATLCYATLCYAMPSPPILMAQRHPRDPRQSQWRSATAPCPPIPMAQRHPHNALPTPEPPITMAQRCKAAGTPRAYSRHARTLQQNQGKHSPPPRPRLTSNNSSLRIQKKDLLKSCLKCLAARFTYCAHITSSQPAVRPCHSGRW